MLLIELLLKLPLPLATHLGYFPLDSPTPLWVTPQANHPPQTLGYPRVNLELPLANQWANLRATPFGLPPWATPPGYPRATPGLPPGHPQATPRLSPGYPRLVKLKSPINLWVLKAKRLLSEKESF